MQKVKLIAMSAVSAGLLTVSSVGLASAASSNTTVGNSGIPRSVFKEERQSAVASVLGTSVSNVQAAHKNHTFKQLLTKAGLTKETFADKVKTKLTADLEAKAYTQQQVTSALQQKKIHRLHHKLHSKN